MRLHKLAILLAILCSLAQAQTTTTFTGTIKDLTGSAVTSGNVTFTLQPGADTTISGSARFTPQTVTCGINGSGLVKANDLTNPCVVVNNTALQPSGTSWKIQICPAFACTSSLVTYALGGSVDITTLTATPSQMPTYSLVDIFQNQTIGGNKIFSGATTVFQGMVSAKIFEGAIQADQYVSLQAAITAAGAGGTVYVPTAIYTQSSTLTFLTGQTVYWNNATVKAANSFPGGSDLLNLTSLSGVHFVGTLNLDGNSGNQTAGNFFSALTLNNTTLSTFDEIFISNSVDHCFNIVNSSKNHFRALHGTNCGVTGLSNQNSQGIGVDVYAGSSYNTFDDIYIDTATGGDCVEELGTVASPTDFNIMTKVHVLNCRRKGVMLYGQVRHAQFGQIIGQNIDTLHDVSGDCFTNLTDGVGGNPDYTTAETISCTNGYNNAIEIDGNYGSYGVFQADNTQYPGAAGGFGVYLGGCFNSISSINSRLSAQDGVRIDGSQGATCPNGNTGGTGNSIGQIVVTDNSTQSSGTYGGVFCDACKNNTIGGIFGGNITGSTQGKLFYASGTVTGNQVFGLYPASTTSIAYPYLPWNFFGPDSNDLTTSGIARVTNGLIAVRMGCNGFNTCNIGTLQDDGTNNPKGLSLNPNGGQVTIGSGGSTTYVGGTLQIGNTGSRVTTFVTAALAARNLNVPDGDSNTVMVAALVTTAAASDNVTVTGMTTSGHCHLTPTNASAATNIATTYVSAKAANQITVTHAVTASMNYDVMCTDH